MAHPIGAKLYNVFVGESRLIPNVQIVKTDDKNVVKLVGDRAHKRWEIRKADITRKVKISA